MRTILLAGAAAIFMASSAFAADHTVEMLNKGADGDRNVFQPAIVYAEPGDTITFVSVDRGHNAESVEGAIPEGAQAWKTKLGADETITVSEPGVYAYKCTPHFGLGMVGLIVVGGDTSNLEAVKSARYVGKARDRIDAMIAELEAGTSN